MRDPKSGLHDPQVEKLHLLLVGIDGIRWEIAAEPDVAVNLQRLKTEGSWHSMTMEVPTISAPGWGSILTGAKHEQHGLKDNSCVGGKTWLFPDFLSQCFYKDQSTRTFAAAGWPVLVDPNGLGPIIHPRLDQQKAGLHRLIVRDGETYGYQTIDAEIAAYSTAAISAGGFDCGFTYFCEVDDAGHVFGLMGTEYRNAIRHVDEHIGNLAQAIEQRFKEFDEKWLIVITTDHGHIDQGGHGGDSDREKESFVVAWSPSRATPDWAPHINPWELAGLLVDARESA